MLNLDLQIFNILHYLAGKNRFLDWLGVFIADYLGYFLLAAVLYFIFKQKKSESRLYYFSFAALALIISRGILTEILKFFVDRQRPFEILSFTPLVQNGTPSFPSGHTVFYLALAISAFPFVNHRWKWILASGAALIGIARIYAGVHWPLDIIGGTIVALAGVLITRLLLKKFHT